MKCLSYLVHRARFVPKGQIGRARPSSPCHFLTGTGNLQPKPNTMSNIFRNNTYLTNPLGISTIKKVSKDRLTNRHPEILFFPKQQHRKIQSIQVSAQDAFFGNFCSLSQVLQKHPKASYLIKEHLDVKKRHLSILKSWSPWLGARTEIIRSAQPSFGIFKIPYCGL